MSKKGKKEKEHDVNYSTDGRNNIVKVLLRTFEKISLFDYINHGLATFTDSAGVKYKGYLKSKSYWQI